MNNISSKAEKLLDLMTLEQKVGQMFIARCHQDGSALEAVQKYKLGGFTLYAVDFEGKTPDTVKHTFEEYQSLSDIPLLLAVDEEGGRVVRVSKYPEFRPEPFKYPSELYAEGGIERILSDVEEKNALLKSLGINFNYAPVCDMASDENNFIYHRTLGKDVDTTCEYISAVVRKMNEISLVGSLKHFPGYGDNVDTHTLIAHDSRRLEEFTDHDLLPFKSGIDAGAPIVMVAHNIVECLDPDCPASLSPKVNEFLRNSMSFDGIIMTDSLDMNAITLYTQDKKSAVAAVLAGNDLLCCSSYADQIEAVLDAISEGIITEERINTSVKKLLELKIKFGIIQ